MSVSQGGSVWIDLWNADAERLDNGNTIIAERLGSRVIEVDSSGTIVWQMTGLSWPADVERLENLIEYEVIVR